MGLEPADVWQAGRPVSIAACQRHWRLVNASTNRGNAQALPQEFDQDFYLRNRANHSANVRSSIVAGCRVNASRPQRSHRSHQSPGPRASLSGATVFFQPHLSQTNVKGLGLTGMSLLLCRAFAEFDVPPCSLETTVAVYR